MKSKFSYLYFFLILMLVSCAAPRVAYKQGFDFSKIKTVSIGEFTPFAGYQNSGSVVANEFIRQLLVSGYNVVTSKEADSDVVIVGNVMEYFPNKRYLITSDDSTNSGTNTNTNTTKVVVSQQNMEISGSNVYNLGSVFGMGNESKIIVSNATVGISAYLKDAKTGEVLWSNTYTYEGLDLNTALEGTVSALLNSWKK